MKYFITVAVGATVIAVSALMPARARTPEFCPTADFFISDDKIITEDKKVAGNANYDADSAMPCVVPERFAAWYETYTEETNEPQTEEETAETTAEHGEVEVYLSPSDEADTWSTESTRFYTASEEVESEAEASEEVSGIPIYSVNGETLAPELQRFLYERLQHHGIEWYYTMALCQLYQESKYDPYAEAPNGLDKGIAQFRLPYFGELATDAGHPSAEIFSAWDCLYVYAYVTARNLEACGYDVELALSMYYTGSKTYSQEYVSDVTQWANTMQEVTE